MTNHDRIAALGKRVLAGGALTRPEGEWLFNLDSSADIYDLMSWANRVREHFKGKKIHLCSIVNVKAGGCSENCKFCAQSASYQTEAPRYALIEKEPMLQAAEEAKSNGVTALGIVAAWRGLEEGPILDEICSHLSDLKESGKARPDASLGIIKNPACRWSANPAVITVETSPLSRSVRTTRNRIRAVETIAARIRYPSAQRRLSRPAVDDRW
ncbi:MAG: hypothetical protein U1G07_13090 [Verrucomicrobiota bacterium]